MKILKFRRLFAILALVVIASLCLAPMVSAEDTAPDYSDYDTAIEYLDEYTTHSGSDENFDENSKTALETVRKEMPMFSTFWALVPPIIAIVLALITKEV